MPTTDTAPTSDLDPFGLDFLADPYPDHEMLRDAGPVVWLEKYDAWASARFDEVSRGLGDHATFCSSAGVGLSNFRKETPWRPPSLLIEADPPDHTRARQVVTSVLTPTVVREIRESFMSSAESIVTDLVERGEFDGVHDLAKAFPLSVFPDLVGLPKDGRENLLPYGSMVFNGFGPRNELFTAAMASAALVQGWILSHCERGALTGDGLGAKIHDAAQAAGYDESEGARIVRSFLSAGVDTTVHGIGNVLFCLAEHPDQWAKLKADPSMARAAFEESVRFESPVQTFFRTTTRGVVIGDHQIEEGEKVLFFLGSANRDPRRWEEPDQYQITRRAAGHVGFGVGVHACVGQMIARLEAECVVAALLKHVDEITVSGPIERQLNNTLRGLEHLPLAVTAL